MYYLNKFKLALLFLLVLIFIPQAVSALTLSNPSSLKIKASDDYATDTFSDSYDMSNSLDVWPSYSNVSAATFANGNFSATTTNTDPQIFFLWGGYPNSIDYGRDGVNRRVNANTYSQVAIRMYSSASGTAQFYWFYEQDTSINYVRESFTVSAGWHIYILNNESTFNGNWTGSPITLRLDPINVKGAQFSIDWIHVGKAQDATLNLSWSDVGSGGNSFEAYIDDDQSGYDGTSIGTASISATSANFSLRSIAPGSYYLYLKKDNGSSPSEYSNYVPITINKTPTVDITEPDVEGGSDWASAMAGDPWDMSNSTDISGTRNISGRRYSSGYYTAINAASNGAKNDPVIFLNLHGKRINASRYHRLTVKYRFDDSFDLVRGTMARAGWKNFPSKGWQMTDDLLTYEGWNTISLSLKDASLDVGSYGWKSWISSFRFDPHEDPQTRRFYVDNVKLAANDEARSGKFNITYTIDDADDSNVNLSLYADKDKTFGNGNETLLNSSSSATGNQSFLWNPASSMNGDYYIYAAVSDGIASSSSYSSGPVRVDNYRPRAYTKRVKVRRRSAKRASLYLKLYKAYKGKYRQAKKKTNKRRYQKLATKYYKAYRLYKKQLATANLKWKVKDKYGDNEAYVKLLIQKRVMSKARASRKAKYFKLYKTYKAKHAKTKNRTLRRRYLRYAKRYFKLYRKTKVIIYKTVKRVNYGWTNVGIWRIYKYSTRTPGTYRYVVMAKDRSQNVQLRTARSSLIIK